MKGVSKIADSNVIREDVIKVGWDIEDNPFQDLVVQANEMKKNILGSFEESADSIDEVVDGAEKLKEPLKEAVEEAEKLKEPLEKVKKESEKMKKPFEETNKEVDKTNKKSKEASKSLREIAKTNFASIKSDFKAIGSTITPIVQKAKDLGGQLKNITSKPYKIVLQASDQLSGIVDNVKSKVFSLKNLITAVVAGTTVKTSVGMVADLQDTVTQFEVLLGSADKAQKRVNDLVDFAANTPFTREEIFAASKQLQVFTGDALSTGNSLKLIGDVAAGTGQQFEDVALWTGRLYDSMKSGNAVGEMTSRLQEMGAISGKDRTKIEKLADAGGDITKNWTEVEKIFSKYDGLMVKQSKNLSNLLLGVKTFIKQNVFKKIGEGITEGVNNNGLQAFLVKFKKWRSENKSLVDNMANGIKNTVGKISSFIFTHLGNALERLPQVIQTVKSKFNELKNTKLAQGAMSGFKNIVNFIVENKDKVITAIQGIGATLGGLTIVSKLKGIFSALKLLSSPLGIVLATGTALFTMLKTDSANGGTALNTLMTTGKNAFETLKGVFSSTKEVFGAVINSITEIAPILINTFLNLVSAGKNILTALDPSLKELFLQLVDTAKELIIAFMPVIQDVFGALLAVIEAILPFMLKFIKSIAKMVKSFAKAGGIEKLVKGFIAYKAALVALTAMAKIYNIVQTVMYVKAVLAAKGITLVQAAFKLLKIAMASHPIFLAATAIGLLVGAFAGLSKAMKDNNDPAKKVSEHIKGVMENTKDFKQAIENANPVLADYDKLISSKGNTMGDIDESIADKEDKITEAIEKAIRDQKELRNDDIRHIRKYMNKLKGLEDEKLGIYKDQQTVQLEAMKLELENGDLDGEGVDQIIANAKEAKEQAESAIDEAYSSELARIINNNKAGVYKNDKQFKKAKQTAYNDMVKEKNETTQSYTDVLALVAQKDWEKSSGVMKNLSTLTEDYKKQNEIWGKNVTGVSGGTPQVTKEGQEAAEKMKGISSEIQNLLKMDESTNNSIKQLFSYAQMIKESGGDIPESMQTQIDTVLTTIENLPESFKDSGQQLIAGWTEGFTDSKGQAIDTAEMTAEEITQAVRDTWGIHSPSTVFAEMSGYAMSGLSLGFITGLPVVIGTITTVMSTLIGAVQNFKLNGPEESAETMTSQIIVSFKKMSTLVILQLTFMKMQAGFKMTALSLMFITTFTQIMVTSIAIVQNMSIQVVSIITQMKSSIMSVDLYSAGQHIMQGLENGMLSKKEALAETAKSMANTVKNAVETAMDINSPSRVMYKIGEYIGLGKIGGMESTIPKIKQTAQNMSEATTSPNTNYTPENSSTSYTKNSTSEYTNYSPTFNLSISGTNDDRTMARKVKQWVSEAMDDMCESYESKCGVVREV